MGVSTDRLALRTSVDAGRGVADPGLHPDSATVAAGVAPGQPGRRRLRRGLRVLVGSVLAGLVVLVAGPASAHAALEGSTPAADSVLQRVPASVSLVFDEAVTLLPDSVRVFGPDGTRADQGASDHPHGDAAAAGVALRSGLPDGTYLVSWRVISADSHPVEGAYTFVVGHPTRRPSGAALSADQGSRAVELTLGAARWLGFLGSALGLGGLAFLGWCWPAGWAARRARVLVGSGVATLALGSVLALLLKGPYDAGLGLGSVTDGSLLREVLGTTYGRALDARLFLVAVVVLLLTYREHVPARVLSVAPPVLLAWAGVTFALGGHAAAGGHRALALTSDSLHLAAMSVWLGGLAMLLVALLVDGTTFEGALPSVLRFSSLAAGAVTVLVATGTYQALREVRSLAVLEHTHYGHLLLIKLGVVGLAFIAAAGSRAWVWRVARPTPPPGSPTGGSTPGDRPSLARLRTTVGAETSLVVLVLAVTSMLVTSNPALPAPVRHPVSATLKVGPDRVRVSVTPAGLRRVQVRLVVTDASGQPVSPPEVDASLALPTSQIGPLPIKLAGVFGRRTGSAGVPVAGDWKLAVTVRTTAIDEATAYLTVPIT